MVTKKIRGTLINISLANKVKFDNFINIEPIGYKAPSFSNDAISSSYIRNIGQGFGLLCQAQGFPSPYFK